MSLPPSSPYLPARPPAKARNMIVPVDSGSLDYSNYCLLLY